MIRSDGHAQLNSQSWCPNWCPFWCPIFEGFGSHSKQELSKYFGEELWHFLQKEVNTIT